MIPDLNNNKCTHTQNNAQKINNNLFYFSGTFYRTLNDIKKNQDSDLYKVDDEITYYLVEWGEIEANSLKL